MFFCNFAAAMEKQKIIISTKLETEVATAVGECERDRIFILVDETTERLCLPLIAGFDCVRGAEIITIGATDENKTLESLTHVWSCLQKGGATRHSLMINLGGGMVTDLGGFAASTFKRGMNYINIPTTLLAMVDASVGGKTGINFGGLKNEIGVFSTAKSVILDTTFLKTMDHENICSGYAEMLKHGLISPLPTSPQGGGADMWAELLNFDLDVIDYYQLGRMLEDSVKVKERIVEEDPTEKGIRKALNLGHTVGHAFEAFALRPMSPMRPIGPISPMSPISPISSIGPTLYYTPNPINDIFTFTLRYKEGKLHTPALAVLAPYLSALGTDSLKKQQLEQAWQRISTTMTIDVDNKTFSLSLTGPDSQLKPALELLAHFMRSAKGDDEALKEAKNADKVDRKGFGKQKDDVLKPVLQRVLFGQKSTNLLQLSKQEIKALKSSDLLALFRELQQYDCELFYCGRQPVEYVAMLSQQALPLAQAAKPQADTYRPLQQYTEPTVFFYNVPKSRQNYVLSYDAVSPQPTAKQRAVMTLWDEYFGGGMSSVLFQNVREFRSLAYSTNGISAKTSLATHANEPLGYVTVTGTQADKTLEAVATIDSLLRQMPMKEENLEAARQSVLNDIQNHYPTFRKVAQYVADERMDGYTADPNTELARLLPAVTTQDVVTFHQQYVAGNQHRVWMVIGDKKLTDMKALARFGKIVELKKADVYK